MISLLRLGLLCAVFAGALSSSQPFRNSELLDRKGDYRLSWDSDDTSITFEIYAKTTGYVALGFSPKGNMVRADIIVASVMANSSRYTLQVSERC